MTKASPNRMASPEADGVTCAAYQDCMFLEDDILGAVESLKEIFEVVALLGALVSADAALQARHPVIA